MQRLWYRMIGWRLDVRRTMREEKRYRRLFRNLYRREWGAVCGHCMRVFSRSQVTPTTLQGKTFYTCPTCSSLLVTKVEA